VDHCSAPNIHPARLRCLPAPALTRSPFGARAQVAAYRSEPFIYRTHPCPLSPHQRASHKQLARRLLEVADEVEGEPPPLTHSCRRCHALPSLALGAAQTSHAIPRPHPSKCSRGEPSTYPRPTLDPHTHPGLWPLHLSSVPPRARRSGAETWRLLHARLAQLPHPHDDRCPPAMPQLCPSK